MLNNSLLESPARVLVYDRATLDTMAVNDLSELLQHVPGIDLTDNSYWYGEYYSIRGINGNDRFLVMLNGRRLNAQTGFPISIGNSISLKLAHSVEVVYGSTSVVHGPDAFSGIINIVTANNVSINQQRAGVAAGSYSSYDFWFESQYKQNENKWLRVFARQFKSDGFDFDGEAYQQAVARYQPPLNPEFEQPINDYNILLEWQWNNLKGGFFRQKFEEGGGRGIGQGRSPHLTILNKENRWMFTNDIYWLNWQYHSEYAELDIDFSYHDFAVDEDAKFLEFTDISYQEFIPIYRYTEDESLKARITYTYKPKTKWHVLFGGEAIRIRSIPPFANDAVFGTSTIPYSKETATQLKATRQWETKSALFNEINYRVNDKFSVQAAFRFDHSTKYGSNTTERISLCYTLNPTSSIKLLYGTAFQAPSLYYVNEQWGNAALYMTPNTTQDFNLKNQQVKSWELLYFNRINQHYIFRASYYESQLSDLIRYTPLERIYNPIANDYTAGLRFENIGKENTQGVDISLNAKFNKFTYYAHYSFADATNKSSPVPQPTPLISKHKLWAGVSYQFDHFTLSTQFKWVDNPTTLPSNPLFSDSKQGPSYHLIDTAITGPKHNKQWRWYVKINNLLNRNIEHVGIREVDNAVIPQPSINGMVGVQYTF
ncbi:TonB-dependent receptor plug domain-containing protein [Flocculibacter collagenilyticus]|uniref:TonB-dependent receptor plug domain-containing protein n=1 Tax=Flocculibacter collagenilyticus TaxID=2744479 RepID=UPI0018F30D8D|nr:TonB-dependent receptor [Flocculibacter collagenilyticus]